MLRELLDIHSIITSQHHICLISTLLPTSGQRAGWLQVTRQGRYVKGCPQVSSACRGTAAHHWQVPQATQ